MKLLQNVKCFCQSYKFILGDNPQYRLELNSDNDTAIIWILLTRHITNRVFFKFYWIIFSF